jgi:hypothetical protein
MGQRLAVISSEEIHSYLDRQFLFNILAGFAHSKLVKYGGTKGEVKKNQGWILATEIIIKM